MKKVIVGIVFAILTLFGAAASVSAQDGSDCPANALDAIRNWGTFDAVPFACLKAKQVAVFTAPKPAPTVNPATLKGDKPETAMDITGTWQSLEPGKSVWYKTSSQFYRIIDLFLESNVANLSSVFGFAVFSSDQTEGLSAVTKPVGRGTPFKANSIQMNWKSDYAKPGVWHILITNYSSSTVPYKLSIAESATTQKNCWGYWETLPNGDYVWWIDCGRYTTVPEPSNP